jgi:predicted phosphate transport protein (TIGR00153 family)
LSEKGFSSWFVKRRESLAAKHILDHVTKVVDTTIDLDNALTGLLENRHAEVVNAVKTLYLDERAADSLEVMLFEDLSKGELDPKQREALMRAVRRIDEISEHTKQAGLNIELLTQSRKTVPREYWTAYSDLSKYLVRQCKALRSAVESFGRSDDEVLKRRAEVKNLEDDIDEAYFRLRKKLILSASSPLALVVLTDILSALEDASDSARDAADSLYILVMANR